MRYVPAVRPTLCSAVIILCLPAVSRAVEFITPCARRGHPGRQHIHHPLGHANEG